MKSISKHFFTVLLCASALLFTQCKKENINQENAEQKEDLTESSLKLQARALQDGGTFEATIFNCAEDVNVTGKFHFVFRLDKITNSGRISGGLHLDAQGTGVGLSSGEKYLWRDNWTEQLNYNITTGSAGHQTFRHRLRIIGTGGAPSYNTIEVISVTVNANGVVTVDKFSFESSPC
jgi:hypothetical protein